MDSSQWWCKDQQPGSSCFADGRDCTEFYGDSVENPVSPLEIVFDGVKYQIPAESLLIQQFNYCEMGVALDDGTIQSDWILLGGGFFKDFVTTVDYDNNSYGFGVSKQAHSGAEINGKAPTPNPDNPSSGSDGLSWWAIMLIILAILFILLLILLCLCLFCCKRDKEEKEEEGAMYSQVSGASTTGDPMGVNGTSAADCRTLKQDL